MAAAAAAAEAAKKAPELLKAGLEIFKELKSDFDRVLGLKQYAEHLSNIVQTMKEVNAHIDEEDRQAVEKFTVAKNQAERAMTSAQIVISTIKAQTLALIAVLQLPDGDMGTACEVFANFVADVQPHVSEAHDRLGTAAGSLEGASRNVDRIVRSLSRVQANFVNEMKKAQANQRAAAFGGAAAGILGGPIGLIISYSIAAGVCEGKNIPEIEKDFERQRKTIEGYKGDFDAMKTEATRLRTKLTQKRDQLIGIQSQMTATSGVAKSVKSSSSPVIPVVLQLARDLVQMA